MIRTSLLISEVVRHNTGLQTVLLDQCLINVKKNLTFGWKFLLSSVSQPIRNIAFHFVFSPTCDSEPRFSNSPASTTMPQVNLIEHGNFN